MTNRSPSLTSPSRTEAKSKRIIHKIKIFTKRKKSEAIPSQYNKVIDDAIAKTKDKNAKKSSKIIKLWKGVSTKHFHKQIKQETGEKIQEQPDGDGIKNDTAKGTGKKSKLWKVAKNALKLKTTKSILSNIDTAAADPSSNKTPPVTPDAAQKDEVETPKQEAKKKSSLKLLSPTNSSDNDIEVVKIDDTISELHESIIHEESITTSDSKSKDDKSDKSKNDKVAISMPQSKPSKSKLDALRTTSLLSMSPNSAKDLYTSVKQKFKKDRDSPISWEDVVNRENKQEERVVAPLHHKQPKKFTFNGIKANNVVITPSSDKDIPSSPTPNMASSVESLTEINTPSTPRRSPSPITTLQTTNIITPPTIQQTSMISIKQQVDEEIEHENVELVLIPDISYNFRASEESLPYDVDGADNDDDPGDIIINTALNKLNLNDTQSSSVDTTSLNSTKPPPSPAKSLTSRKFLQGLSKKFTPASSIATSNSPSIASTSTKSNNSSKIGTITTTNDNKTASELSSTTSKNMQSSLITDSDEDDESDDNESMSSTEMVTKYLSLEAAAEKIKVMDEGEDEVILSDGNLVRSDSQSIEISVAESPAKPKIIIPPNENDTKESKKPKKKKKKKEDAEWKAVLDKSTGNVYYYHTKTRETTWEKPNNTTISIHDAKDTEQIQKHLDQSYDPITWAKRTQLAKIIAKLSPNDMEANDKLMDLYLGREDELMANLMLLQEETPFDEPSVSASETFCNWTTTIGHEQPLSNSQDDDVEVTNSISSKITSSNTTPNSKEPSHTKSTSSKSQSDDKSDDKSPTPSSSQIEKSNEIPRESITVDSTTQKISNKNRSTSPASRASSHGASFFASLVPSSAAEGQIINFTNSRDEEANDMERNVILSNASSSVNGSSSESDNDILKDVDLHLKETNEDADLPSMEPRKQPLIAEEYTGTSYKLKSQEYSNKNRSPSPTSEFSDSLFMTDTSELDSFLSKKNDSFLSGDSDLGSFHSGARKFIAKAIPRSFKKSNSSSSLTKKASAKRDDAYQEKMPSKDVTSKDVRRQRIPSLPKLIETKNNNYHSPSSILQTTSNDTTTTNNENVLSTTTEEYSIQNKQAKRSAENWAQTDFDLYISQNDWDSVIDYIAKYKHTNNAPIPHNQQGLVINNTASTLTTNYDERTNLLQHKFTKTLGARSKLQHEDIRQKEYKKRLTKNCRRKKRNEYYTLGTSADEDDESEVQSEQYSYDPRRRW